MKLAVVAHLCDDLCVMCRYTSACSNNIRDSMQASMRVRHLKSGNLFYASYPKYIGTQRFDALSRARLRDILDGREKYAKNVLKEREDPVFEKRDLLEEWQKVLWVLNTAEDNTSAFLHQPLLTAYLRACGYEIVQAAEQTLGEAVETRTDDIDYFEIPEIPQGAMASLEMLIQGGTATAEDKLRFIKAYFQHRILRAGPEVEDGVIQGMFKTFAKNQLNVTHRLANHFAEVRPEAMSPLDQIFQDNQAEKVAAIKEICEMLGIESAISIGQQIHRSVMEATCAKVVQMRKELQKTFNLRMRESGKSRLTLKRGLEILNGTLHTFGITGIVENGPRTRRRVDGKLKDTTAYVLEEQSEYSGFVRHTGLSQEKK